MRILTLIACASAPAALFAPTDFFVPGVSVDPDVRRVARRVSACRGVSARQARRDRPESLWWRALTAKP